jgi:hypothetical protein
MSIFYQPNEDQEYDDFVARVDAGEECPTCHASYGICKSVAMGFPLFICSRCSSEWFDWVTRPTMWN